MSDRDETDLDTLCARGPEAVSRAGTPLVPPIAVASTFAHDDHAAIDRAYAGGDGWIYGRYANPTVVAVERWFSRLEGAERTLAFATGMAAISTTIVAAAGAGGRVLAQAEIYGGTDDFLRRDAPDAGLEVERIGCDELARLSAARLDGFDLLYLEVPANPLLRVVDLGRLSRVATEAGCRTAVDATFATPVALRPATLGVDYVLHSATKYLGGHGDLMGGLVSGSADGIAPVERRRRTFGGTMDPFTAFLLQRGLRTLGVRMRRHTETAALVAAFLTGHERVERVYYPGERSHPDHDVARRLLELDGGMVAFEVRGGGEAAVAVHDRLRLFRRAGSLGGVESLVSLPARMSHRGLSDEERDRAGIRDGLVRLSVGLEGADALVDDLRAALDASA